MRKQRITSLALIGLLFLEACGTSPPALPLTEFLLPTPHSEPEAITAGPDGNLWFTTALIGRITPAGKITTFPLPTSGGRL
jgi:virginiamycin B lyase